MPHQCGKILNPSSLWKDIQCLINVERYSMPHQCGKIINAQCGKIVRMQCQCFTIAIYICSVCRTKIGKSKIVPDISPKSSLTLKILIIKILFPKFSNVIHVPDDVLHSFSK